MSRCCWTCPSVSALVLVLLMGSAGGNRDYDAKKLEELRSSVSAMFHHAYDGYLRHAHPLDELRPLSCDGVDTWGSYSLTLIDALDTLLVVGNVSEFRRVYHLIAQERTNFDADVNVSVFETNIRILGGLLSGHLFARRAGIDEYGWPCEGPLLSLAKDVGDRLLPAFDTPTGMPYGTVNLRSGVPEGETPVTCTAGVGTMAVEFGTLSRLTGDPVYEETAIRALRALWHHRSKIGLMGNHIDVLTGKWTATDAGIGAGVDSYYEYLVKGGILLQRPELIKMFRVGQEAIEQYNKHDDWHFWVSMHQGQVSMPVFQSLEAFWPGTLSLLGENMKGLKTMHNYHQVWKQYGFLPEFYNVAQSAASAKREGYPLRPELVESAMYLYRATGDPFLLSLGEDMLASIEFSAKTECGYATVKNVRDHTLEDRMESFFLAETTKYLYLLFDPDHFIHNPGNKADVVKTKHGECIVDAGGYIFNTEAHPVDPAALACCYSHTQEEIRSHMASHMLNVLDPTYFNEFQGDLVPARLQQIQTARQEEAESRLRKKLEYEAKMREQREKEEERQKRRKELEELRKQAKRDLEAGDAAKRVNRNAEFGVSESVVSINLTQSVAEGLMSDDDEEEAEEEAVEGRDEEGEDATKPEVASEKKTSGSVPGAVGTVERLRGGVVETVSSTGSGGETVFKIESGNESPEEDDFQTESGDKQKSPEFSHALKLEDLVLKEEKEEPGLMIKRQSKDEAVTELNSNRIVETNDSSDKTLAEALAGLISKFLPNEGGNKKKRPFDMDEFRYRILSERDRGLYPVNSSWYEDHFVLGCPARTFRERFSLQGEFFENY